MFFSCVASCYYFPLQKAKPRLLVPHFIDPFMDTLSNLIAKSHYCTWQIHFYDEFGKQNSLIEQSVDVKTKQKSMKACVAINLSLTHVV